MCGGGTLLIVSNHQPHGCLLNRLFRRRSKKTSKLRVTGPVNSPHKGPVTREMFPFDDVIMLYHRVISIAYKSRGNWVLPHSLLCSLMICTNNRVHHGQMVTYVCLHITLHHLYHHGDAYQSIERPNCLSGIFCRGVSKIKSILSILFHATYRAVCSVYPLVLRWLWEYVCFILLLASNLWCEPFNNI